MYLGSAAASNASYFLSPNLTAPGGNKSKTALTPIVKALREGMPSVGIKEDTLLFVVCVDAFDWGVNDRDLESGRLQDEFMGLEVRSKGTSRGGPGKGMVDARLTGDVFVVKAESLDEALWKIGGAAVGLRLVQLASVRQLSFFMCSISSRFRYRANVKNQTDFSRTFADNRYID
jgi:hypothetical protein